MTRTKPEPETPEDAATLAELTDEEASILDTLDEVEQTIEAMSDVLASLRERLARHLHQRASGPSAVLEEWPEDPEPRLH